MLRAAFVFLSIIMLGFTSAGYASSIAKVVATSGAPTASGPSGTRTLSAGSELFEHDKITVSSGNAQVLFIDGTKLVVGPGSTLVVEKFLLRGGTTAQNFSIAALRGTFRFITGKSPKSAYNIKTANATIGIRGTGFDFWVLNNTGVAVLEGKVKLCNRSNNCVRLNAGCELGVSDNSSAKKLTGPAKSSIIDRRLPFLIDQNVLRKAFRLKVSDCRHIIDATSNGENLGFSIGGKPSRDIGGRDTPNPPFNPIDPKNPNGG